MRTEKATKKITQSGDSLVINVTKEVKRLGLDRGDAVDITLTPAMADDLAFIVQAMANAIVSLDLDVDDNTGAIYASRSVVDTIYRAVSLCAGPSLVVGMDATHAEYITVDVFAPDNTPLVTWVFWTNKGPEDHD